MCTPVALLLALHLETNQFKPCFNYLTELCLVCNILLYCLQIILDFSTHMGGGVILEYRHVSCIRVQHRNYVDNCAQTCIGWCDGGKDVSWRGSVIFVGPIYSINVHIYTPLRPISKLERRRKWQLVSSIYH